MLSMLKRPSAWLPIAMSSASLAMLLGVVAWHVLYAVPVVRDPDEGAVAHLFQILQTVQVPIGVFFAVRWLPRTPKPALMVLGLQVLAWFAPVALVFYLGV